MRKSRTLAGVAVLASVTGIAHAQSSVTLYGVLDVPVEYVNHQAVRPPSIDPVSGAVTKAPGGNKFSLETAGGLSGARWGIRGVEDLGGGTKALFVLESGFGVDDGKMQQGGRLFGRQAMVGIQDTRFGQLSLGRQYTSLFDTMANFSPSRYASLFEPVAVQLGTAFREDNTVKYAGVFGALTATAHYSFGVGVPALGLTPLPTGGAGETPGHAKNDSAYGAGLMYASGGLGIGAAYDQWNPAIASGSTGAARKAALAASYIFGPLKLMGGYRWGQIRDTAGRTLVRDDYWWIGANYDATSTLSLNLAYYYDNLKTLKTSATQPGINPANPWQVNVSVDYAFSRRTDVYMTVAYVRNSGLNFDSSAVSFVNGAFLAQGTNSQTGLAIGVRHKF